MPPGFYVHIDDHAPFLGAGIWRPEHRILLKIRDRIVSAPDGWRKARDGKAFREHFELGGDSLRHAPRGYDPDHPLIDDLRRTDVIAIKSVPREDLYTARIVADVAEAFASTKPLLRFLCAAIEVPF